ncbi:hypothetical protein IWZ00DRAFT_494152 [Phyllosticta capitalensis]|uniref:uncharacterized protein n=1 Tax=Phyllosticta capitalensis TaxID=121624 RepID=UPI00312DBA41
MSDQEADSEETNSSSEHEDGAPSAASTSAEADPIHHQPADPPTESDTNNVPDETEEVTGNQQHLSVDNDPLLMWLVSLVAFHRQMMAVLLHQLLLLDFPSRFDITDAQLQEAGFSLITPGHGADSPHYLRHHSNLDGSGASCAISGPYTLRDVKLKVSSKLYHDFVFRSTVLAHFSGSPEQAVRSGAHLLIANRHKICQLGKQTFPPTHALLTTFIHHYLSASQINCQSRTKWSQAQQNSAPATTSSTETDADSPSSLWAGNGNPSIQGNSEIMDIQLLGDLIQAGVTIQQQMVAAMALALLEIGPELAFSDAQLTSAGFTPMTREATTGTTLYLRHHD